MRWSLLLLLALFGWVVLMSALDTLPPSRNPILGIAKPGLAMEFASSGRQVDNLLAGIPGHDDSRSVIIRQQFLDVVFIGLYWLLFVVAVARTMKLSGSELARRFGLFVTISISAAAILDLLEDVGILCALKVFPQKIWPIWFGPHKWLFFFLTLAVSSPVFLLYPKLGSFGPANSKWTERFACLTGILFVIAAGFGIVGVVKSFSGDGSLVIEAGVFYASAFLFFLFLLLAEAFGSKHDKSRLAHA